VFSDFDQSAMKRALELAARGLETTDPNPRVGCVVAQGERVIGEGWHERPGEAHAEVAALRAAREDPAGATVYVTLEPCSHFGRTPPCINALISARVGRVVFAVQDPNPLVSGKGAAALGAAGIAVDSGLMEDEAVELNAGFMKRMKQRRPWVRLKLAMSLDGRTALANGVSQWITGEVARDDVQHWRARSSVVLTGAGTLAADDPRLDVRLPGENRRQPLRVVLDARLRTSPSARLFSTGGKILILTASDAEARSIPATGATVVSIDRTVPLERLGAGSAENGGNARRALSRTAARAQLTERGAQVEDVPSRGNQLDLGAVLDRLVALEVNEVLLEAGAKLAGAFLKESLVDEMLLYVAPKLLGPQARPLIELPEIHSLDLARQFVVQETVQLGDDLRIRLRPRRR
jgi:diaminohydroxyphosphoribosylaminopyrimidine deaminase/5-amino-6-(5-phosphoribosylamino)uracil reductase